ncbi:hypothetical protein I3842_11G168500 [Carya illinoinensis]|uniref:SBP-type domain-containing protein n=1 Tax=Carya illinoinensis TaxID=32201 RepID=A0A922J0N4_CARIL|nr:hypothetical protein I3842_11G168500 [Carya illinoinensis]
MEAKSFEGKRTFKEKVNRDAIVEDQDVDDDLDEEEGGVEMISFVDNDQIRKKAGVNVAVSAGKRTGSGSGGVSPPCCQAEKCGVDLTDAKRYHRRHRVCEFHSKAPTVIVAGQRQRFCQQCSRFHEVSEFDEAKRSCRRRLAGHNERRRKGSADQSGGEAGSSRKGVGQQSKETSQIIRQTDDHQRGRIQVAVPAGNSSYKHLQIR